MSKARYVSRPHSPKMARLEYLLGTLTALGPLTMDLYLPGMPTIRDDLGVSSSAVELTIASYFIGFAVGQLLVGPFLDRNGRLKPLRFGLILYLLATIACAVSPTIEVLIGARFFQALGGAFVVVVPRAIVRDLFRGADIARAMSRLILVMGVAPIFAPTLGGFLLVFGWRALFGVLVLFGLTLLVLSYRLPETHKPKGKQRLLHETRILITDIDFMSYTVIFSFAMGAMFAYIAGSSNVFHDHYQIGERLYAILFSMNAAAFLIMSQVSRWFLDRITPQQILNRAIWVLLLGAGIILFASTTGTGGLPLLMLGLTVYLGALGVLSPNSSALALDPHGERAGLASSLMGAIQGGTAALLAFIVSYFNDGTPGPLGKTMAGAILVSALALLFHQSVRRRKRRLSSTP